MFLMQIICIRCPLNRIPQSNVLFFDGVSSLLVAAVSCSLPVPTFPNAILYFLLNQCFHNLSYFMTLGSNCLLSTFNSRFLIVMSCLLRTSLKMVSIALIGNTLNVMVTDGLEQCWIWSLFYCLELLIFLFIFKNLFKNFFKFLFRRFLNPILRR